MGVTISRAVAVLFLSLRKEDLQSLLWSLAEYVGPYAFQNICPSTAL